MKKIVFSGLLKLIAVVLFIASIACGVLTVTNGIITYEKEEYDVYSLESDFAESWYAHHLLTAYLDGPELVVFNAYQTVFRDHVSIDPFDHDKDTLNQKGEELADTIQEEFDAFYDSDMLNYYVRWNDVVITNCGAETPEELMEGEYFSYVKRDGGSNVERISVKEAPAYCVEDIARLDTTSTIIISCNVKEEVIAEYRAVWERQEGIVMAAFTQTLICAAAALLLFIYLLCVCGKNKDGEYKNMWLDNVWLEIHLALIGAFGIGAAACCVYVIEEYLWGYFPYKLVYLAVGAAAGLGSLVIITSLLSIVRNIKTRRLVETSIILRVLRWCLRLLIKIAKWLYRRIKGFFAVIIRALSKKTGVIVLGLLLVYTALIGFMGIGAIYSALWLFLAIALFGFACFVTACRAKDLDEIKKGASQVRSGNVAYKIAEPKSGDMKELADNINHIAKGLDESVAAKVKAERLKSELITNVSHDLKTPITSIISYTELLTNLEGLPEEAKDYVSVIAKKSDRLKRLTQDLFDISKAQSGNEAVVLEKLDVALLIHQALGEHDNEIQSAGLPFCVEAPKDLYISADGRKMSRVFSNLINNILKYTMKNTRVFITASEKSGNVEIEFKNISAYPLTFRADEITQRFVRGDESRTAEGNGLGLAIAKSYTEICGGNFEIVIDGDMFKAILKFKKENET